MTDETLKKVHGLQLLLANEVKRICQQHHLKYFLIAGTLLGAVRHQGFIPWDDDMDIGLLREDYDRFIALCETELDRERFFLQTFHTDPGYGLCFAKLHLKGTTYVERNAAGTSAHRGIYLDIFPFDNVPDDPALQKKHNRKTYLLKRLLLAKLGYRVWEANQPVKRLVYGGLALYARCRSRETWVRKLEQEMQRYNGQKTRKIVAIGGSYGYWKESILREWVDQTCQLPFEDTEFAVPGNYTAYLEYFYGDYMTPPPEDKRGDRHRIIEVDFGPYA